MQKKYVVRLNEQEREELQHVVKRFSGTSQKVKRAQVLLKADADGPAWIDARIADAFGCRTQTIENIRQRLVEQGFRETLDGKQRVAPPTVKVLDGAQEARIIALQKEFEAEEEVAKRDIEQERSREETHKQDRDRMGISRQGDKVLNVLKVLKDAETAARSPKAPRSRT